MKIGYIIRQLTAQVPNLTILFSEEKTISSLTRSGSTVTAVTSTPHDLSTGDYAVVKGAVELNPITSLTRVDSLVTAVTQEDHFLTIPNRQQIKFSEYYDFNKANISGANETEYNGEFIISTADDRNTFQYTITGTPTTPATGSPVLEQTRDEGGYNGRVEVTVINTTTFTYPIVSTPLSPAGGTINAEVKPRISGSISLERVIRSYTAKGNNELWAFVVAADEDVSRDRSILSDASNEQSKQTQYRVRFLEPFSVYIFIPGVQDLTGIGIQEQSEELRKIFYNSLLGFKIPTIFGTDISEGTVRETWSMITPEGAGFVAHAESDAFVIYQLRFNRVVDVTYNDTIGPDANVPFRDLELDMALNFGTGEDRLLADINLDNNP